MTRPANDVERVAHLLRAGIPQAEAARLAGVPRGTVQTWVVNGLEATLARRSGSAHIDVGGTMQCELVRAVPTAPYAYLLGLYLGDGCLSKTAKGVYRLRIVLDQRYKSIIAECRAAMGTVIPRSVGVIQNRGCIAVNSYSKHWPCLFPQHGLGRKHLRPILLEPWQSRIALDEHPRRLLRGLIHSDGCRVLNRIGLRYSYPRYMFSNRSADIRGIFTEACARVGIQARQCGRWQVSVAAGHDVALLDTFIGPKT